jgi:hypothetical protein
MKENKKMGRGGTERERENHTPAMQRKSLKFLIKDVEKRQKNGEKSSKVRFLMDKV